MKNMNNSIKSDRVPSLSLFIQFVTRIPPELTRSRIRCWVRATLIKPAQITLRFVSIHEAKNLNALFRGKNYATNVLTFPYHAPRDPVAIADIIICLPIVKREAREQKKYLLHHIAHLIVHGVLHAQGFDHMTQRQAKKMEALEIAILEKFKVPNPYL